MKTNQFKRLQVGNIPSKLALSLPFLLATVILIGFLIAGIIGRLDLAIRGLIIAVPSIASAIILCNIYKNKNKFENINVSLGLTQKQLAYLFFIVYFSSLTVVLFLQLEPGYIYVISLLYLTILLQIFLLALIPDSFCFKLFFACLI